MAATETVTLTAPNGMRVTGSVAKLDRLLVNGYTPVESDEKPAKKVAAKKSAARSSNTDK